MTQRLLLSAALALVPITGAQASTLSDIFTSFYVLGDSNSDFGNLGPNGPPPPYFKSQFSNGPVWADILDDQFETADPNDIRTWNYAFGGARVTEDSDVPDLPTQLAVFGADLDPTIPDPLDGTPVLGDRPLVAIWFGANDIRSIFLEYLAAVDAAAPLDLIAQGIAIDEAEALARAAAAQVGAIYGATIEAIAQTPGFNDLLAFTTADAGATPEYDDPTDADLLRDLSILFNDQLLNSLGVIEGTGKSVYTVDVFDLQQQVAAAPAAFGFDNVTDPCLTFDLSGPQICATPETYLFWDEIGHLSGAGHAALASIAEQTVLAAQPAPVPLPASLPALGLGLAAFGAFRARQRKVA